MIIGHGDIASAILTGSTGSTSPQAFRTAPRRTSGLTSASAICCRSRTRRASGLFLSLCVYGGTTRYAQHKREMENLIERTFPRHTIVRVGTITWGSNPHTLINHLRAVHQRGEQPDLRPVYRYPIHLDEFRECLRLECGGEIDLIARRMTVAEIYQEYVSRCP